MLDVGRVRLWQNGVILRLIAVRFTIFAHLVGRPPVLATSEMGLATSERRLYSEWQITVQSVQWGF